MKSSFLLLLSLSLVSVISFADTQPKFYRYTDKDGSIVINSMLPPEFASKGYDIVTPRGNLIEHVPPKKSAIERLNEAALLKQQEAERLKAIEQKRQEALQAENDAILLKMYTRKEDILRTMNDKIASIEVLINITKKNISQQEQTLAETQKKIDTLINSKQPVPKPIAELHKQTQENIQQNKEFLDHKQAETNGIRAHFQQQVERFEFLQQRNRHKSSE